MSINMVLFADITITGNSGLFFFKAGKISRASPSGNTTSKITASPSPSSIHRHKVDMAPVDFTLQPALETA